MTSNLDAKLREILAQEVGHARNDEYIENKIALAAMCRAYALGRETMRDEAIKAVFKWAEEWGGAIAPTREIRAIPIMPEEKAE